MEDGVLALLQESAIELIRKCKDEDLLDLVCKLLLESGVLNAGIIP